MRFSVALFLLVLTGGRTGRPRVCDVELVLRSVGVPAGAVAVTLSGVENVQMLLVPTTFDPGTDSVTVTSAGTTNLYWLYRLDRHGLPANGEVLYVKTRSCLDLLYNQHAVLRGGQLIFNR